MYLIDVNGNPFYYYGDLELNDFEKEHKRLSYSNMLKVFTDGCFILNNKVASRFAFDYLDENKMDAEIFQYYIISSYSAGELQEHTNEVILYNEGLDIYLLGVTHFGTGWEYVLTDIEIGWQ